MSNSHYSWCRRLDEVTEYYITCYPTEEYFCHLLLVFVLLVDWGKQCKYYICFLSALSISFVIVREDHKNYTFKNEEGIKAEFILHIFDICQCANWLKWTWRLPLLAVLRQLCALFVTSSSKNRVETSLCSRLGQATGTGDREEVSSFP